ncbi:hypothetical protein JHK82_016379 [Glycine max]|nr:hypothetical protein JHK82_016379 [Glycine max]
MQPPPTPPAPPPCSHVPPPMAGQRDSPIIGLDSSTIDFPVSVWQHHHADINRHFQSIQLWPLPLRTNTRRYRKIPYGNEIFLLGDATVTHQIHLHWIWILFATATPLCSVHHQRQRPPPPPKPPPPPSSTPPSLTPPLIAPQCGSHTHSSPWPFSFVARVTHSLTALDINNVGPKPANKQSLNAHEPEKGEGGGNEFTTSSTPSSGGLRGQGICHEL